MTDDELMMKQLASLDPTRADAAPARGSARYDSILAAAMQIDPDEAGEVASTPATVARLPQHRAKWGRMLVAAVLAAFLAVAVLWVGQTVHELKHPATASAAQVMAQVRHNLATFKTLSATIVSDAALVNFGPIDAQPGSAWPAKPKVTDIKTHYTGRIMVTDNGCLRTVKPLSPGLETTYKADGTPIVTSSRTVIKLKRNDVPAAHIETVNDLTGTRSYYTPEYAEYNGKPPASWVPENAQTEFDTPLGPSPDTEGYLSTPWREVTGLDGSVLSILAHGVVSETVYDGRPALVVGVDMPPESELVPLSCDRMEMTVDKATLFPVRFKTFLDGQTVEDTRLTHIKLDVKIADSLFSPSPPKDAKVEVLREHFARVTLSKAAHGFDYRPLAPTAQGLPKDFRFFTAAVAPKSLLPPMQTKAGKWFQIASYETAAIQYRAGFLAFTVTTRRAKGMHDPRLVDPFVFNPPDNSLQAAIGQRETVTIESGALQGVKAQLVMPTLDGFPHLWAFHNGLMVTIAGDLTRDQLLKVANSLEPLK